MDKIERYTTLAAEIAGLRDQTAQLVEKADRMKSQSQAGSPLLSGPLMDPELRALYQGITKNRSSIAVRDKELNALFNVGCDFDKTCSESDMRKIMKEDGFRLVYSEFSPNKDKNGYYVYWKNGLLLVLDFHADKFHSGEMYCELRPHKPMDFGAVTRALSGNFGVSHHNDRHGQFIALRPGLERGIRRTIAEVQSFGTFHVRWTVPAVLVLTRASDSRDYNVLKKLSSVRINKVMEKLYQEIKVHEY